MSPNDMFHQYFRPQSTSTQLTDTVLPALAIFGAGMMVGASVALLTAPKPGRELRQDIGDQAKQLTSTVREKLPALTSRDDDAVAISRSESQAGPVAPTA